MASSKPVKGNGRKGPQRIPLTITLDVDDFAFLESCVSLKEFDSVDRLFDAALAVYRKHVQALDAYAEEQSHKGYSRAEVLQSIECETVIVKPVSPRLGRKR
jgi:hypothetical protein